MIQCMDSENLHRRFKKIIGQIQAIDRMVDEDIPCEDILAQINAAKSALHKAGQVVLEGHIQHCVREGIEKGDADNSDDAVCVLRRIFLQRQRCVCRRAHCDGADNHCILLCTEIYCQRDDSWSGEGLS